MFFVTTNTLNQDRLIEDRKVSGEVAIVEGKALDPESISSVEIIVRDYFSNTPVLAEIAYCESTFRQYDEDGGVLRGVAVPTDVGVMQINEYFHQDTANTLGIDLYSLEGNLAYAKWLYEKEGTVPWNSSQSCWQEYKELAQK